MPVRCSGVLASSSIRGYAARQKGGGAAAVTHPRPLRRPRPRPTWHAALPPHPPPATCARAPTAAPRRGPLIIQHNTTQHNAFHRVTSRHDTSHHIITSRHITTHHITTHHITTSHHETSHHHTRRVTCCAPPAAAAPARASGPAPRVPTATRTGRPCPATGTRRESPAARDGVVREERAWSNRGFLRLRTKEGRAAGGEDEAAEQSGSPGLGPWG
jgi:hypothetical protein